jgi:aryl-alcohol dehydrogenase-like predicted oxidoreductase
MKSSIHPSSLKIIIGTANFGSEYGTGKLSKKFPKPDIEKFFGDMVSNTDVLIDTANSYGKSELLIGRYAPLALDNRVITKISIKENDTYDSVVSSIKRSLDNVQQNSFLGVLIHNANFLNASNANEIVRGLLHCQDIGLTKNIGVSCYEVNEIIKIKNRYNFLTNYQLPENVADRRNSKNADLLNLKMQGYNVFIRSVFLQGTLVSDLKSLPNFLKSSKHIFQNIEDYCKEKNISKLKYCLDYARTLEWNSGIVLGIQNFEQYKEILGELQNPIAICNFPTEVLDSITVDPRNWIDEK